MSEVMPTTWASLTGDQVLQLVERGVHLETTDIAEGLQRLGIAYDPRPRQVLDRICAMRMEPLRLHVEDRKQVLYMGTYAKGNCVAWIEQLDFGWKIGVRGCLNQNLFLVRGRLYVSRRDKFDQAAFGRAEPCPDVDAIVAKLYRLSVNWLSKPR